MSAAPLAAAPIPLLSSCFDATELGVRVQLEAVSQLLDQCAADPDRYADMQVVLSEVLNNIVEHSCVGMTGAKIDLTITQDASGLMVETRDMGRPVPPSLMKGAQLPPTDVPINDLPEGGFGWFIIHSLADEMDYERIQGTNVLSFRFLDR